MQLREILTHWEEMSWVYLYQIKIQSVRSNQSCSENARGTVFFAHPVVMWTLRENSEFFATRYCKSYDLLQHSRSIFSMWKWELKRSFLTHVFVCTLIHWTLTLLSMNVLCHFQKNCFANCPNWQVWASRIITFDPSRYSPLGMTLTVSTQQSTVSHSNFRWFQRF